LTTSPFPFIIHDYLKGMAMSWFKNNNFWNNIKSSLETETIVTSPQILKIDVMKDDIDPNELTIENAYKTRWIWYHTILAIEIFTTNLLLLAILVTLAIKL
jgi:hypothetical protein|tara:strand:+ start:59 stop:361 length:303 start_codon:yes stop_codon:yes gene_type:complete